MAGSITNLPLLSDTKSCYRTAQKLRTKRKAGKPLTPEQSAWLTSYEAAHPSPRKGQESPSSAQQAASGVQPVMSGSAPKESKGEVPPSKPTEQAPTPLQGGGVAPPIDLFGSTLPTGPAATPGATSPGQVVSPAHEQQCQELAAQFCMMLDMAGKKVKEMGGTPLSPEFITVMIGPSMKRILMRHMPTDGSGTEYLDYGVVFGGCAFQGQQYLSAKKAVKRKQESAHVAHNIPVAPAPAPRERNPYPSDWQGPPMPTKKIDPAELAEDDMFGDTPSPNAREAKLTA